MEKRITITANALIPKLNAEAQAAMDKAKKDGTTPPAICGRCGGLFSICGGKCR